MTHTALASSFRDPSGFVYERDGVLLRQVQRSFATQFDALTATGLYDALLAEGLIIPHEEVGLEHAADPTDAYKVLRPERVALVSYPYEWCPGQLRAAALATIRAQRIALDHGMSLRDASAYNVAFHRGRAVLIDTLSFEPVPEGQPWIAYRQYCQHFLAPLALVAAHGPAMLQLSRVHLDGVPLDLAASLLPSRTKLKPGLLAHIHAHARSQRHYATETDGGAGKARTVSVSLQGLKGLAANLEANVERLSWEPGRTTWSDYYAEAGHYTDEAMAAKERLVTAFVDEVAPASVWDLGANTGRFSRIAASRGIPTLAFDIDPGAVEANWRAVETESETHLLPLVLDLANPSPSLGWANEERDSIVDRGPAGMVLALALVHHLAIGNNVPLPMIAAFLATLTDTLVIEFVPKQDPKVQLLLAAREDVFPDYTQQGFEDAFGARWRTERCEPLPGSERLLYLLRRRV